MLRELCSGSGNRTSRPSGYEPDELPTALSRDIGLQIYGHFLNLQIFIAFFEKDCHALLAMTITRGMQGCPIYYPCQTTSARRLKGSLH